MYNYLQTRYAEIKGRRENTKVGTVEGTEV